MKKRISLLVTLALSAFIVAGCDGIAGFLPKKSETPTEQEDQNQPEIPENTNFTVTFNANGGSGSMTSDITDGSSYYVTRACEFTYTGRSFVAWALNSVQGPRYELGDMIYDIAENITLYAIWETINYRVTFNANGGTGTMQPDTTEGSSYYVTRDCEFEYDGHRFKRWALNSPDGALYDLGDTIFDINDDIILYALWEEINYNVSFNANGGTGTMLSKTTSGSTYITPVCTFTYGNHAFDKWALDSATGAKYSEGETIENISKDITLFATWVEDEVPQTNFTVTFNSNGGSGTMESQLTNGDKFIVPECAFTRESYTFKNWAYESKNGVEYSPGETIKNIAKDITLYALWEEQTTPIDPENPDIPAGYYSQCEGLTGSALEAKLKAINPAKNPDYDWSRYEAADEAEDDANSVFCIYTRHNIPKGNHVGSGYAWDKWNREHIWTQSLYPASKTDNHNIFACEGQINNDRGNLKYAEGGNLVSVHGHQTECRLVSGVSFEPCDAAKGEVARSVMYGTVMYSYTMTNEIESIELALKWHLQHEITTRETRRNNVVYGNQGNRNPFVDHPEYACKIWGTTNSATRSLCGM